MVKVSKDGKCRWPSRHARIAPSDLQETVHSNESRYDRNGPYSCDMTRRMCCGFPAFHLESNMKSVRCEEHKRKRRLLQEFDETARNGGRLKSSGTPQSSGLMPRCATLSQRPFIRFQMLIKLTYAPPLLHTRSDHFRDNLRGKEVPNRFGGPQFPDPLVSSK